MPELFDSELVGGFHIPAFVRVPARDPAAGRYSVRPRTRRVGSTDLRLTQHFFSAFTLTVPLPSRPARA
jgi:hypothetical protein